MSYRGHYYQANMYMPGAESSPVYPPGYTGPPQLHPSVLHYQQNMAPPYNMQQPRQQQGMYFPPPPSVGTSPQLGTLPQLGTSPQPPMNGPPQHSPITISPHSISPHAPISPMSMYQQSSATATSDYHALQQQHMQQQQQQQQHQLQQQQHQHRRPSIQDFNISAPPHSSPPPPPPSSINTPSAPSHRLEYPRSTVETALMFSESYPDREPGEVILHQPSESERQAMLCGVIEDKEQTKQRHSEPERKGSPETVKR